MSDAVDTVKVPFEAGDWISDRNKPGQPGQFTGKWRKLDPYIIVQISYPDGGNSYRPISSLEPKGPIDFSIADQMRAGRFGKLVELKSLLTPLPGLRPWRSVP